jgi:protein-L-isoaspartate(D-aspartate) O-methyltransferase
LRCLAGWISSSRVSERFAESLANRYTDIGVPVVPMKPRFALAVFLLVMTALSAGGQEPPALARKREAMVRDQIQKRGVEDARVLAAMRAVPRHLFVPAQLVSSAYDDNPLPIGEGQTISQPYIVALMTELLETKPEDRILEIGTGSGYQAAVLSGLVREVYTIEIKEGLQRRATETLERLGYRNVHTLFADGYFGWPGEPPFDGIMITAAVDHVPPPLLAQLKDGGRMVLPLGSPWAVQELVVVTRKGESYTLKHVLGVLFVPMTGRAQER